MRRTTAVLLALLLPVGLLAACGDDGDDDAADDPVVAQDGGSDEGADGADGDGDGDAADDGDAAEEDELRALLLSQEDLGEGWAEDPDSGQDDTSDDDDGPECLEDPDGEIDPDVEVSASFSFQDADELPSVQQEIARYPEGTIEEQFELARSSADSCGEFTFGDDDGLEYAGSLERLADVPTYGDDSAAYAMRLTVRDGTDPQSEVIPFTALVLLARTGDLGVTLLELDLGDGPTDFADVADRAFAKLDAA